eukprot:CAMPEP_0171997276 /NCGR_PEP_ID=MMETSP1041-20130122/592_1 /TAXON_ID=464988 /ORGANISM="Hemiselmis andersenii, Strain CCMP439" /LENGTH=168 /DNA_ID=CAMNT_0012650523 /DNA_START=379 /DNA_END=881 /DNA_ORIENTATION=+
MNRASTWARTAAPRLARAMCSSSRGAGKPGKRATAHSGGGGGGADGRSFDQVIKELTGSAGEEGWKMPAEKMWDSFPLFRGEGGVIESNRFYVHGITAPSDPAEMIGNHEAGTSNTAGMTDEQALIEAAGQARMSPAVAEALKSGFVGKRYKERGLYRHQKEGVPGRP